MTLLLTEAAIATVQSIVGGRVIIDPAVAPQLPLPDPDEDYSDSAGAFPPVLGTPVSGLAVTEDMCLDTKAASPHIKCCRCNQ